MHGQLRGRAVARVVGAISSPMLGYGGYRSATSTPTSRPVVWLISDGGQRSFTMDLLIVVVVSKFASRRRRLEHERVAVDAHDAMKRIAMVVAAPALEVGRISRPRRSLWRSLLLIVGIPLIMLVRR